jgi:hypothetical protein
MGLGVIFKLKEYLTPRNLQYLDVLLGVVTDKSSPAFEPTWEWFKKHFPPEYHTVAEEALGKLHELRLLVQQYRDKDKQSGESDST